MLDSPIHPTVQGTGLTDSKHRLGLSAGLVSQRKNRRQWVSLKQEDWRLPELGSYTFSGDKYWILEEQEESA